MSQSQESCGLDSVCLNGGYTPNTFTLHGLGTTPGSRAGVVGSADLLRDGGVGLGGDDISPALLTPHGAGELSGGGVSSAGGGGGMRRNLSDAAALEKMIISELVQSNLRPSAPMPVPPERYGSLARPHLSRHGQLPPHQEGWAATIQPGAIRHNGPEGWQHLRQQTQDGESRAPQDGWSHSRISGDGDKDGERSLQGTLGRRGLQDRQQPRPPDVQARPYATLSRAQGTLSRHRAPAEAATLAERERYRDRPLPPPPPPPPQEQEPLYRALEEPLLLKNQRDRERDETFLLKRDVAAAAADEWRAGGGERGRGDEAFAPSRQKDGGEATAGVGEWRGAGGAVAERAREEARLLLEKRGGKVEAWRGGGGGEAEQPEAFITQKKDFGLDGWRGEMARETEEPLFLKERDGWRVGGERDGGDKAKERAVDVWRGGLDVERDESFLFEGKDGRRGGGPLRYGSERDDSDGFTLPLTPDLDLDADSSPLYARDADPSPLYPGEHRSPPLGLFPRSSPPPPPQNIFSPPQRDANSPPGHLYTRHSPQVYSRSSSPPRFYTRTSPPTLSYPDSSPEGLDELSPPGGVPPGGQRPGLELPYGLGRPPLGPRPNHLQTFYQPPPPPLLASNGESAYAAEPSSSEGEDGQMQRVTSL